VIERRSPNQSLFRLFAAVIFLAALYHAVLLVKPEWGSGTPAWRHALFVGIDLAMVFLMLRRPPWFWIAFALLTLQQLYGHGAKLLRIWRFEGQIDWISLVTMIGMPIIAYVLYRDWRVNRESGGSP
jgi:hypothetical protein